MHPLAQFILDRPDLGLHTFARAPAPELEAFAVRRLPAYVREAEEVEGFGLAGLDGIQNKLMPGEPMDKNLYDLPPAREDRRRTTAALNREDERVLPARHLGRCAAPARKAPVA